MARRALVTGSAGFIGFHLCRTAAEPGWEVTGLDAMTPYYDVALKERRLAMLKQHPGFTAGRGAGRGAGAGRWADGRGTRPDAIIHLAAQAGVRYSIERPAHYVEANLIGTFEVLEAARAHPPAASADRLDLVGLWREHGDALCRDGQGRPSDELSMPRPRRRPRRWRIPMPISYGIPTTMFRFFTVYGPWGRPDMAPFKFTRAILAGRADRRLQPRRHDARLHLYR